jgi:hypothetical protein
LLIWKLALAPPERAAADAEVDRGHAQIRVRVFE